MKDETDTKASDEVMTEGRLVYAVSAIIRKASDRALASWDLTVAQAPVLVVLREAGCPITIGDLARLLMLEGPSVTAMVDRLSERGLVERFKDLKDRRKTLVQLTKEGKLLAASIREPGRQLHEEMFGVLTDEERQALRAILRKFCDENIAWLE
jgi:DNA-binding MarR family transcriptional regulator